MSTVETPAKSAGWWRDPTTITILAALLAAVPPITTAVQGWFQSRSQLELTRSKQAHEIRQKYLDRVLSEAENRRVLQFLVAVEDDEKLKAWAQAELKSTEQRIKTKQELYSDAIRVVAKLANQEGPIDPASEPYKRFWELYNTDLLPVESQAAEAAMVEIGRELRTLEGSPPNAKLKNLSFGLAATLKQELR
jgi:hypothetical protein